VAGTNKPPIAGAWEAVGKDPLPDLLLTTAHSPALQRFETLPTGKVHF